MPLRQLIIRDQNETASKAYLMTNVKQFKLFTNGLVKKKQLPPPKKTKKKPSRINSNNKKTSIDLMQDINQ